MFKAYGLSTQISSNNTRTLLLMAGFPVLLLLVFFAFALLAATTLAAPADAGPDFGATMGALDAAISGNGPAPPVSAFAPSPAAFDLAIDWTASYWPVVLIITAVWFAIAYVAHQSVIGAVTGARPITRADDEELYNLLENLCISRGLTMPRLAIAETDALNAFASGLDSKQHMITVTRGLRDTLSREELEAVLAHELTHVRNKDVQLLVIAVIFVGIFSFLGELVFRNIWRMSGSSGSRSRRSGGGSDGAVVLIAIAIIALAWALAVLIRFAISRSREYVADAGAVELTKNPDALVRALQRISGNAEMPGAPEDLRAFFIENETKGFAGLFATHPPIAQRIDALRTLAGAQV